MHIRSFGRSALLAGLLLLSVTGAALAAATAAPPKGEPMIKGATYASGKGAPYLSVKGAPRRYAGRGIGPLTGAVHKAAIKAGTRAGKLAGKKVKPLHLKIGYLDIIGGIESADRVDNSLRVAFQKLGSTWVYCDGQGNPTKWTQCGNSLLAQGVDVIALTGIDPSTIPTVVQAAKAKGVPIVDFGGQVGPGYATAMAPNEAKAGRIMAQYLKAKLATRPGTSDILTLAYPAPWAQIRTAQLKKVVASDPKLKIAQSATVDPTNLIAGTQKTVTDELTANPSLGAIWVDFDTAGQAAGQVVAQKYAGKSFPNKPLVVTFHADPSTIALMRKHAIDAVVSVNYDATAWELADAVAEHFARGKKFPKYGTSFKYPGIGDPLTYAIVTPKNLPKPNHYVAPRVDVVSYFEAKWKTEGLSK